MNIFNMLIKTIFYSESNLNIALHSENKEHITFNIKYKNSICGSLFVDNKKLTLVYSRGLHLYKGIIDFQNIILKYNNNYLELYTKNKDRRILKARCNEHLYEVIKNNIINKELCR